MDTQILDKKDAGLNYWRNVCFGRAMAAGWYQQYAMLIDSLKGTGLVAFADKLWQGQRLALIHSEVSEALEGVRKDKQDEHLPHLKSVDVELADVLIRIFDYAGQYDIDLDAAVRAKLAYNAERADHKPENRAKEGGKAF